MLTNPLWIPIVAIVGGLSIGAFSVWIKHREKMAKINAGNANQSSELEALKQRVEALETIVTDSKEQLKRKIDNL